jgi:hypothetical protein
MATGSIASYGFSGAGDLKEAARLVDEASHMDKEHLPPDLLAKVTKLIEGQ